jgi:four helix bundle protein
MIRSFKDLEVYKESYDLAIVVNKLCKLLPLYERNDLGSQMRRCSKSPPSNIAEGWAKRRFEKEMKVYLDRALGSCNEMEVHLSMARDLEYLNKKICDELITRYIAIGGKITNLRNKWRTF